jgi:hypothetical protein
VGIVGEPCKIPVLEQSISTIPAAANMFLGEDLAGLIQVASLFELKECEFLLLGRKQ